MLHSVLQSHPAIVPRKLIPRLNVLSNEFTRIEFAEAPKHLVR